MKKLMKKNSKGLTLVEVLVSMTIFAITSLVLATMVTATVRVNISNHHMNEQMNKQAPDAEVQNITGLVDQGSDDVIIQSVGGGEEFELPIKVWTLGAPEDIANYKFFTND